MNMFSLVIYCRSESEQLRRLFNPNLDSSTLKSHLVLRHQLGEEITVKLHLTGKSRLTF